MGVFANIMLEEGVELPHFPESVDHTQAVWQSKRGVDVYGGPYKITENGRLLRKNITYREKTTEERLEEAQKWGFDSWQKYVDAYENSDSFIPDEIEYSNEDDETPPTLHPREKTIDEVWWADHNMHGTFEFHTAGSTIDEWPDAFLEYEARFTRGQLQEIVLVGERLEEFENGN